jgi:hypothetical protein
MKKLFLATALAAVTIAPITGCSPDDLAPIPDISVVRYNTCIRSANQEIRDCSTNGGSDTESCMMTALQDKSQCSF